MAARKRSGSAKGRRKSMKIKSGDQVQIVSGKDRGKKGRVLRTEPRNERVYVEGISMVKRHVRPDANRGAAGQNTAAQLGGVIEREGPIHVSNVALLDPKGQPTRIRIDRSEGKRSRVAASTGAAID